MQLVTIGGRDVNPAHIIDVEVEPNNNGGQTVVRLIRPGILLDSRPREDVVAAINEGLRS